jgi:hypothetical protein
MPDAEYAKAPVPFGKAVKVMAEALINHRWGQWHPEDGHTEELWNEARDGDLAAAEDDMATALKGLEDAGLLAVDWNDDDLQDCGCPGSGCTCETPRIGRAEIGGDDA